MSFAFRDPNELSERMASGLLEAHEKRPYPVIHSIYTVEGKAGACVYNNNIYAVYASDGFIGEVDQFAIGAAYDKHLYFYLTQLHNAAVRELAPFLSDYDLSQLITNRQYSIVEIYLQCVAKEREIPPAAMKEPLIVDLFLDAGWFLEFGTLFQYYNSVLYRFYYQAIKKVLECRSFTCDGETRRRFLELALERGDQAVCELLDLHT